MTTTTRDRPAVETCFYISASQTATGTGITWELANRQLLILQGWESSSKAVSGGAEAAGPRTTP